MVYLGVFVIFSSYFFLLFSATVIVAFFNSFAALTLYSFVDFFGQVKNSRTKEKKQFYASVFCLHFFHSPLIFCLIFSPFCWIHIQARPTEKVKKKPKKLVRNHIHFLLNTFAMSRAVQSECRTADFTEIMIVFSEFLHQCDIIIIVLITFILIMQFMCLWE